MIATLPMYDRPETRAANDRLWAAIAAQLPGAPDALNRELTPEAAWTHPNLLFSQTCGLPYRLGLHAHVQLVACPDFRLPDTPPGYYHSVIVARRADDRPIETLLAARFAVNDLKSQSGHNALYQYARARKLALGLVQITGAHVASARAVAEDRADVAAIDANTWRGITRWEGWASQLRVVDRTPPTPAMPYITSPTQDATALRHALSAAISGLSPEDQACLGLYGCVPASKDAFMAVSPPPLPHKPA